ncbi:MAG: penicillin-binding protein 2 [Phycisphaeraceae bacterium]|nr:penicillin-binding protein 2 [Phycisphaeraceae bacterium]
MSQISHEQPVRRAGLRIPIGASGTSTRSRRRSASPDPSAWRTASLRRSWTWGLLGIALLCIALSLLVVRAVAVMRHPDQPIQTLVNTQVSTMPFTARRGDLLDRKGQVLATSDIRLRLFVDPKLIGDREAFLRDVARVTGLDAADIAARIDRRPNSRYVVLDPDLDPIRVSAIRELGHRALGIERYSQRIYPHASLAGQTLGIRTDHAAMGVERAMDGLLAGRDGRLRFVRDARFRPLAVPEDGFIPAVDGHDVRLSLDVNIQRIVERHLAETCEQFEAPRGQVVVMDPHTGEVLAMANYPSMNPMELSASSPRDWNNACISEVFEPGSIFKPFVWALLIESGKVRPDHMFDCGDGVWRAPFGRRMRDVSPHGRIDFDEILIKSSNIGMAQAALRMRGGALRDRLRELGFGQPTGIGLPGEAGGLMTSAGRWSLYTQTSVSMGHEIAVTPLQMMTAFSALANGGRQVRPTVRMVDPERNGDRHIQTPIILSEPVSAHTRSVLHRAVMEGTGRALRNSRYPIFGKTGTAQVPATDARGYEPGAYIASFVGGAPVAQPRIVIGCFIHRPNPARGYYGGVVAAPLAGRIIEDVLAYMGTKQ